MARTTCGPRTLVAKTCLECGELKMAKAFPSHNKGLYYGSYCYVCHRINHTMPGFRNSQEKALEGATNHYKQWTEAETQQMLDMTSEGHTVAVIALTLNRTVYSIFNRRKAIK